MVDGGLEYDGQEFDAEPLVTAVYSTEWLGFLLGVVRNLREADVWAPSTDITAVIEQVDSLLVALMGTEPVGMDYVCVEERYSTGNNAGDASSGTNQRILNSIRAGSEFVSLSSGKMTLAAGTWVIQASAPGFRVDDHQLYFHDADEEQALLGSNAFSDSAAGEPDQTHSLIGGRVSFVGTKEFTLDHWCKTAKTGNGLGRKSDSGQAEVYARVEAFRIG